MTVNLVELVNTHNGHCRDRSMEEFKVFLSDSSTGPWEKVVHQTLEDSRQQEDPLPVQKFFFSERAAQFVKFNQISYYGHSGGLQYFTVTSGCPEVSVVRGDHGTWTHHGHPEDTWAVASLLTKAPQEIHGENSNYWKAPDGQNRAEFVLDLGCKMTVNLVELVNTHNGHCRDRSMKEFKVFLSDSSEGPWEQVVHQTLEDSRQQEDPLPVQKFSFSERAAQFVKFNQISYYGHGGGLQYFAVTSGCSEVSVVRGDHGTWNGHPEDSWAVVKLLTKAPLEIHGGENSNYWL